MEKPVEIAFKDMEASEALESAIRERVAWLERFHPRITSCRVVVDFPYRRPAGGRMPIGIAVEIEVPGHRKVVAKEAEREGQMKSDRGVLVHAVFEAARRQLSALADRQEGEVKAHPGGAETGQIVRLFPEQDYGFVELPGSPDLYFTRNAVKNDGFNGLQVGETVRVTRATTDGPMGPQASSVAKLGEGRRAG